MRNGTKMPVVPITIGSDITAQVFTTDWIHSENNDQRFASKAFDRDYNSAFHSRIQDKQAMKITFDQPQVYFQTFESQSRLSELFKN